MNCCNCVPARNLNISKISNSQCNIPLLPSLELEFRDTTLDCFTSLLTQSILVYAQKHFYICNNAAPRSPLHHVPNAEFRWILEQTSDICRRIWLAQLTFDFATNDLLEILRSLGSLGGDLSKKGIRKNGIPAASEQ